MKLAGKVALITGGGSGLGRGMAECFAAEGSSVLILEIRPEYAGETESALKSAGYDVAALVGDVRQPGDVRAAVARCVERWGRLDILINNAGVSPDPAQLTELPLAEWERVIDTNLNGPFVCIHEAAPAIRDSGGGSIINISSISARSCYPGRGAYSISKAALDALTCQAAVELGAWKIRVNAISPGWFRTALNEDVYRAPGELARRNATIPLGRIGSAEDTSKLALFLASDDSDYITGESIEIDGGLHAASLYSTAQLARMRPVPVDAPDA